MGFYEVYTNYRNFDFDGFFQNITPDDVRRALLRERKSAMDFLTLVSPQAEEFLEPMAQLSNRLTIANFGRVIQFFTPLYLANYCTNHCVYCGFNHGNDIKRSKLSFEEVEAEGKAIAAQGILHLIILTGDSVQETPVSYIAQCARILQKYVSSISIEVYALSEEEYRELKASGVDGFTMFQECYDEALYKTLHPKGPKHDYHYRLDAPERACKANFNTVNIGALLGLADWRKEIFFTALHAQYLQDHYPGTDIAVSLPRIRPCVGGFTPQSVVSDKNLVQAMTALRLFIPRLGITISTREEASFRDHLIGLGVTKMSAGAITEVGGHSGEAKTTPQFEISDERSQEEMSAAVIARGYQPVYKDWDGALEDLSAGTVNASTGLENTAFSKTGVSLHGGA